MFNITDLWCLPNVFSNEIVHKLNATFEFVLNAYMFCLVKILQFVLMMNKMFNHMTLCSFLLSNTDFRVTCACCS